MRIECPATRELQQTKQQLDQAKRQIEELEPDVSVSVRPAAKLGTAVARLSAFWRGRTSQTHWPLELQHLAIISPTHFEINISQSPDRDSRSL